MAYDEAALLQKYKQTQPKSYEFVSEGIEIITSMIASLEESYIWGDTILRVILELPLYEVNILTTCIPEKLIELFPGAEIKNDKVHYFYQNCYYVFSNFEGIDENSLNSEKFFNKKITATLDKKFFTVETLVLGPKKYITDVYKGYHDCENKVIRTIYNPAQMIKERPELILEALYYMSEYNLSLDKKLQKTIFKESRELKKLKPGVIAKALRKILAGKYWHKAMSFAEKADVFYQISEFETFSKKVVTRKDFSLLDKYVLMYSFVGSIPDASDIDPALLDEIREKMSFVNLLTTSKVNPMMVYHIGEKMLLECDMLATLYKKRYFSQAKKIKNMRKNLKIQNVRELKFSMLELNNAIGLEKKTMKSKVIMNLLLEKVINGEVPNNAIVLSDVAKQLSKEISSIFNYVEPTEPIIYNDETIKALHNKYKKEFEFLTKCFLNESKDLYSLSYFERQDIVLKSQELSERVLLSTTQYTVLRERGLI